MISIKQKSLKGITKVIVSLVLLYTIIYIVLKFLDFAQYEKDKLALDNNLHSIQERLKTLREEEKFYLDEIKSVNDSYIKKEALEQRVKDIFSRMSLADYTLSLLDAKSQCIDNYILVARLDAKTENGKKAGEGILSYLGSIKKHSKNDSIYFVNYIDEKKNK